MKQQGDFPNSDVSPPKKLFDSSRWQHPLLMYRKKTFYESLLHACVSSVGNIEVQNCLPIALLLHHLTELGKRRIKKGRGPNSEFGEITGILESHDKF